MSGIYWKRFRIQYKFSDTETRDMLYAEHTLFALLQSPQLFGPVNSWRSNCHQRWHTLILHLLWNRTHVAVNRGPIYGLLCLFFKALQGNYAYQISLMLHDTSNTMNTSAKSEKHIYKKKLRRQALIHQSHQSPCPIAAILILSKWIQTTCSVTTKKLNSGTFSTNLTMLWDIVQPQRLQWCSRTP